MPYVTQMDKNGTFVSDDDLRDCVEMMILDEIRIKSTTYCPVKDYQKILYKRAEKLYALAQENGTNVGGSIERGNRYPEVVWINIWGDGFNISNLDEFTDALNGFSGMEIGMRNDGRVEISVAFEDLFVPIQNY